MTSELSSVILGIFEQARQRPGTPYEPDRLLAFLTEPPSPKGRRVADTFAGRRRFVRFMNAVQLELGLCFTLDEWERGFGLDDLVQLAAAKIAKPDQGLRLAQQRLEAARGRRISDPIKFGLLTLPLLVGAGLAHSWLVRVALAMLWTAVTGGVAALAISEARYSQSLVNRLENLRTAIK